MWISISIVFIISFIVDLFCYQKEEELESVFRSICRRSVTVSLTAILLLIYLFDKINGNYVWFAFVAGVILFIVLEITIPRKGYICILQSVAIIVLGGYLVIMTLLFRYELQTKFFKPCWSPDGKHIAFFMQNSLIQYKLGIPFSLWSPDPLWHKYYLCTMNYDGKNFRQIKQNEQATDEISWSGSGNIVYIQHFMQDVDNVLQSKIMYTSPDGKKTGTLYETAKIPTKSPIKENEIILDPWLSMDKRYLGFVLNYRESRPEEEKAKHGYYYDNYRLLVKDLKTQQNKVDILQRDVKYGEYNKFYGSFMENKIAYKENQQLIIVNLDSNKNQQMIIKTLSSNKDERIYPRDIIAVLPIEYNLNSVYSDTVISPERKMIARAGGVWTIDNKVVSNIYIKPKRSYLFNIFSK